MNSKTNMATSGRKKPVRTRYCRLLITLLLAVCANGAFAQYEDFLHKPYVEMMDSLSAFLLRADQAQWSNEEEWAGWNRIKDFARKHRDVRLELGTEFYLAHHSRYKRHLPADVLVALYRELIRKAGDRKEAEIEVSCLHNLAELYYANENYEASFAICLTLADKLGRLPDENYPDKIQAYLVITLLHYAFREYELAIPHLQKAIRTPVITERNARPYANALNTLGLCYQEKDKLDSAAIFYRRIIDETRFSNLPIWETWTFIASENLGDVLVRKGQYEQAIPLYIAVIDHMETVEESFAVGAAIRLADAYVSLKNSREAGKLFDNRLQRARIPESRRKEWFAAVSRYHALTGNFEQSLACRDSAAQLEKKDNERFNAMRLLRVQQELHEEKQKAERMAAESFRRSMTALFVGLAVFTLLLSITLGIWIYYSRLITKKNRTMVAQIKELQAEQERREVEMLGKTTFEPVETPVPQPGDTGFCPESRRDKLCIAIRDLILKDKIYRNPVITRDYVVNHLGTNKDLFIDAFQFCFGISFTEYINMMRLKDSVTLLEQSDILMEEISEKVGFGSVRTFYRQFQNKYNISPQSYRKLAKEKQD
jgi:AraC-like DNA-binding protein/tetratricopeptide (TPR) repeat protein